MPKQTKTEVLYEDTCSIGLLYVYSLAMEKVPAEYRKSIKIETEQFYYPYDNDPSSKLVVSYERPETDEEYEARTISETATKLEREARELEYFNKLKLKYDN